MNKLFCYYGNGEIINNSDIGKGFVYYNQNISSDVNWSETLNRNGLKIIQINRDGFSDSKGKFYNISVNTVSNRKLDIKKMQLTEKEIVKLLTYGEPEEKQKVIITPYNNNNQEKGLKRFV